MNAYEREPYQVELEVEVVSRGRADERPYVVLDDTILYPEGGGQPADHGHVGDVAIVDVQRVDGEIRHFADDEIAQGAAHLRLDWQRRFDHMQQHTAQHLITAVAADEFGWQTTSFHLGGRTSDIELDAESLRAEDLLRLEERVNAVAREARVVSCRHISADELATSDARSRGLPADHTGDVRLVEIEGIDSNTCGGTHVRTTAEVGAIKLLGTERLRGGTRLVWAAGDRVRRLLADHEARAAQLRATLETSDDEMVQVAAAKLERLKDAERRVNVLNSALATEAAARLASSTSAVIDGHFDGADASFLQAVARELTARAAERVALLTATSPAGSFFVLCRGPECAIDLSAAGQDVAGLLQGRGGGGDEQFQGKAGSLRQRPEAIACLETYPGLPDR